MAFFKKLLGLQSADELRAEADALFEQSEFGRAKLAYEQAHGKVDRRSTDVRGELEERIAACRDRIAEQRISEGDRQRDAGHMDLAQAEYEGAADVAADPDLVDQARHRIDDLEGADAVAHAAPEAELGDEDRLAVLAGTWEADQADEYEALGPELDRALLALLDQRGDEARQALEAIVEAAPEPRYLWLEVARARMLCDDVPAGTEALRTFLGVLEPDEGGEARLSAHLELARLADEAGDFDAAVSEFQAAIEALEEDPRPYLWLGRYLREKKHPAEAVDVIESALAVMDSAQPDWRVLQELGLAQADAGRDTEAVDTLEQVLRVLATRRHLDFPPETALTLARLHEKQDHLERAADLYRQLTQGSDRENHALYYREGARVLEALGLDEEARRMASRAAALDERAASDDEQAAASDEAPEEPAPSRGADVPGE